MTDTCPIFVWSEYTCEDCGTWYPVTAWVEDQRLYMHVPGLDDDTCCSEGCWCLGVRMTLLIEEESRG